MGSEMANSGIVLRCVKLKEYDLIVTFLTPKGSALSLVARSALRSRKRFGGGLLEAGNHLEFRYKKPKWAEGLGILSEASLICGFEGLRTSYDKIDTAMAILKWARRFSKEEAIDNETLFSLVGHGLKSLEASQMVLGLRIHFLVRLMYGQGVLEPQEWMRPFLTTPMAHHGSLKASDLEGDRLSELGRLLELQVDHANL